MLLLSTNLLVPNEEIYEVFGMLLADISVLHQDYVLLLCQ